MDALPINPEPENGVPARHTLTEKVSFSAACIAGFLIACVVIPAYIYLLVAVVF